MYLYPNPSPALTPANVVVLVDLAPSLHSIASTLPKKVPCAHERSPAHASSLSLPAPLLSAAHSPLRSFGIVLQSYSSVYCFLNRSSNRNLFSSPVLYLSPTGRCSFREDPRKRIPSETVYVLIRLTGTI